MNTLRRLAPAVLPMVLGAAFVMLIAACGKKGEPSPPPDQPVTYPRSYPSE